MPGVVGLGVVVVVVVVVVDVDVELDKDAVDVAAKRACSKSFSIEMGVVGGVGQPVNAVVALNKINSFNGIL